MLKAAGAASLKAKSGGFALFLRQKFRFLTELPEKYVDFFEIACYNLLKVNNLPPGRKR